MSKDSNIDKWDGSKYKKYSSLQYNAAIELLQKQVFQGNESILDIGCGDGKITNEIANLVPSGQVIGIDSSPSMLQEAKKFNRDNLQFQLKDAQKLDFSNQFDIVTSFFCLQWVSNKLAAFKGIMQALKFHGKVLIIVPMVGRLPEITNELMTTDYWKKYFVDFDDPLTAPRDTQYDMYAKQAGLIVTAYKIVPIKTNFPSREALSNWLFAVTPHLIRVADQEEKEHFIQNAVDLYIQEFPVNKDGSYDTEFTLIKLFGTKNR